jgi:hypothetical protein
MNLAERVRALLGLESVAPYFTLPPQNFTSFLTTTCTLFYSVY